MNYFLCNCTCHSSYFTVLLYMRIIYEKVVVVVVVVVAVINASVIKMNMLCRYVCSKLFKDWPTVSQ